MEEDKQDKKLDNIWQFLKTPKGKAVAFFGAYLIFFVVLSILARASGPGDVIGSKTKLRPYDYNLAAIKNNNFKFQYQYVIDNNMISFTGEKNDKKALFSDGVTNYYQNDNLFMKNQNGVFIKCDNPFVFSSFLDMNVLENILKSATYLSKTQLATGEEELVFQVTTTTLVKILDGVDVDLDDPVNTIKLKKDSTGNVVGISYDLGSYAIYKKVSTMKFELALNYSDFGKTSEISDPA